TAAVSPRHARASPARDRRRGLFHRSEPARSAAAAESRQRARGAAGKVPWASVKSAGEREGARRRNGRWYAHAAANRFARKRQQRCGGRYSGGSAIPYIRNSVASPKKMKKPPESVTAV